MPIHNERAKLHNLDTNDLQYLVTDRKGVGLVLGGAVYNGPRTRSNVWRFKGKQRTLAA